MKKSFSKFNIFLSVFLLLGVTFSIITIVSAVTPNPGHPWAETGDGVFAITGPTALRTFTFPDADATVIVNGHTFTGDVAATLGAGGTTALTIASDKILESHLKVVDAPVDEDCLTYEATGGDFEWQACGGGGGASTALDNLAAVAINTTLVSDTDNTDALGTSAIAWSDLFLGSGGVITFNSAPSTADITLTHSADTLTFAGGTIVLGTATATGGLTGNVTGNVSGTAATVTGAAQTAITSVGTLTNLDVDNININLNTISSTAGTDLLITPLAGQQLILDGTIVIDAGVVTGATSITSTSFVGALTGNA